MKDKMLDTICKESGCTPDQVRQVVTLALRELHLVSATDYHVTTGAVMECCWNFGVEASYHLGGILTYHDYKTNDPRMEKESLMPETMARVLGCGEDVEEIKQKWFRYLNEQQKQSQKDCE